MSIIIKQVGERGYFEDKELYFDAGSNLIFVEDTLKNLIETALGKPTEFENIGEQIGIEYSYIDIPEGEEKIYVCAVTGGTDFQGGLIFDVSTGLAEILDEDIEKIIFEQFKNDLWDRTSHVHVNDRLTLNNLSEYEFYWNNGASLYGTVTAKIENNRLKVKNSYYSNSAEIFKEK